MVFNLELSLTVWLKSTKVDIEYLRRKDDYDTAN